MERQAAGICIDRKVLKQISSNQANFMLKRINDTQRKFGDLCSSMAAHARGHGKMRDRGDEVSRVMCTYAKKEQVSCTTAVCLQEVAHHFSVIQDHAESTLRRFEEKVVKPLSVYGSECHLARDRIKKAYASRKKELETGVVDTDRRNACFLGRNILYESDEVVEEIEKFERRHLTDLKQILSDFVSIEMFFHARAVENLSEALKFVSSLNVDTDLELFRVFLRPLSAGPPSPPHAKVAAAEPSKQDESQKINQQSKINEQVKEDEEDEDDEDDDDDYDDDDDDDTEDHGDEDEAAFGTERKTHHKVQKD